MTVTLNVENLTKIGYSKVEKLDPQCEKCEHGDSYTFYPFKENEKEACEHWTSCARETGCDFTPRKPQGNGRRDSAPLKRSVFSVKKLLF